jgi:hypothetical protein
MPSSIACRLAALLVGAALGSGAHAALILTDPTHTSRIAGIDGTTHMLAGLAVTMTFASGLSESVPLATSGGAWGAAGTGWRLDVSGDTFDALWSVTHRTGSRLVAMALDGGGGGAVFDRTDESGFAGQGTPLSLSGQDFFAFLPPQLAGVVRATYSWQVAVGDADPIGDLWHRLVVDFSGIEGGGVPSGAAFEFIQDTDDVRAPHATLAEPPTLGLVAIALLPAWRRMQRRFRAP